MALSGIFHKGKELLVDELQNLSDAEKRAALTDTLVQNGKKLTEKLAGQEFDELGKEVKKDIQDMGAKLRSRFGL